MTKVDASFYKHEVANLGMPQMHIFVAYLLGFTIEYLIASAVFYNLVSRARNMMEKCYSAEEENRMKSRVLSSVSHEIRTPMNAITADAIAGTREKLLAAGMDEYISKPIDSKKLAAVIEQYL